MDACIAQCRAVVSEIYSPRRVTRAAELLPRLNIDPGLAMDITTEDETGQPWDFSREAMKAKARFRLKQSKPELLIGSPMCTAYSAWQGLNKDKDIKAFRKRLRDARAHLEFVCELYEEQMRGGRPSCTNIQTVPAPGANSVLPA